jgi:hypothetical protein
VSSCLGVLVLSPPHLLGERSDVWYTLSQFDDVKEEAHEASCQCRAALDGRDPGPCADHGGWLHQKDAAHTDPCSNAHTGRCPGDAIARAADRNPDPNRYASADHRGASDPYRGGARYAHHCAAHRGADCDPTNVRSGNASASADARIVSRGHTTGISVSFITAVRSRVAVASNESKTGEAFGPPPFPFSRPLCPR